MKKVQKSLAMLLVAALLLQVTPLRAVAAENELSTVLPETVDSAEFVDFPEDKPADIQVVYEETGQRDVAEKHFRLSDGSFIAASYPGPVHYETEEGTWEEIDNTLNLSSASSGLFERMVRPGLYKAQNGEETKSYSAVLRPDETLLSLQNREFGFEMALLSPETAQTLVTEKNREEDEEFPESSLSSEPGADQKVSESSDIAEVESSSQPESSEISGSDENMQKENALSGKAFVEEIREVKPESGLPETSAPLSSAVSVPENDRAELSVSSAPDGSDNTSHEAPSAAPDNSGEEASLPSALESSEVDSELESELPPQETEKPDHMEGGMAASVPAKIENPEEPKELLPSPPSNSINSIGVNDANETALPLEEQLQPQKISSRVTYENVWPGVDLQYYNYGYNIKESIIVREPQKKYRYSFLLNLEGLTPVLRENGNIDLFDREEKLVYQIPAPYMTDAAQAVSHRAVYELTNTTDGYVLTVEADPEWINAEDRQFPVVIDPTLILSGSDFGTAFTASCVTSEDPDKAGSGGESIYIGHMVSGHEMQVFFQFGSLPTLPANCSVVNATLNLYQHTYSQVGMNRLFVQAHEVTSSRPASYATNADWIRNMTWNTKPEFNKNTTEAYARITEATKGSYSTWDISRLVSKWYASSSANRMLAMDAIGPDNFTPTRCATAVFWMNINSKPLFLIHYRNNVGLENRYTYQTSSIGRAGVANISDHAAQLTLANTLFESNSETMPFALTAYYNSPYRGRYFTVNGGFGVHTANYTTMYAGAGWKLSVQETVVKTTVKTSNASTSYYVYTDADGTEHYFEASSSQSSYSDEDGLGYTLSVSGAVSTLKDEKNNQKEFYNGYLTKQTDRNGNAIYYLYNDNTAYSASAPFNPSSTVWKPKANQANRVTQIYQVNDNGSAADVQLLICKLTYSGNFVNKITDASGRAYTFQYTAHSSGIQQLSKITFPDGYSAQYDYSVDTYALTKAYDSELQAGIELAYQFSFGNWCIQGAHEYVASALNERQTVGNRWHNYSSSLQQRLYRFYGQDHRVETKDDITTRYTFDLAGRTINVVNYNYDWTKVLGTSALSYTKNQGTAKTNNRVTGAASSGIAAVNHIYNSGMEVLPGSNYGWTEYASDTGPTSTFSTSVSEVSPVIKPRTGSYLMKMYYPTSLIFTTGFGRMVGQYQTVYLEARTTYVFSGYANSSGITKFGKDGGMTLSFQDSTGTETLAESKALDYATSTKIESGWARLQVSYTPLKSGYYRVSANLRNASEYGAFDDLQLEEAVTDFIGELVEKWNAASSANLLQLGSLETWSASGALITSVPNYWTYPDSRVTPVTLTGNDASRGVAFQMLGHPDAKRRASQTVSINRSSNTTYMLSAWGKAYCATDGAPITDLTKDNDPPKRFFGMIAKILYSDTTTPEYQYVSFNPQFNDWQYTSGFIVPKRANKTVTSITVSLAYDYNINTAWFDEISLTEEPAQTYTYDSNGKLKTVTSSAQSADTYTYSGPDLTKFVSASSGTFNYTYDASHNMTKATNDGVNLTAGYDTAGNNTSAKLQKGTSGIYMQSTASYTADKNHTSSITDVNGITTGYTYDGLGRVSTVKTPYAGGTLTVNQQYAAGTNDKVSNTYVSGTVSLSNTYNKGQISSVMRKSFNGSTPSWQKYLTPVDNWGNVTKVQVQSGSHAALEADVAWETPITLASYEYGSNNGPLTQLTYGNGDWEEYYYDIFGRPVSIWHFTDDQFDYEEDRSYDSFGNIARSVVFDDFNKASAEYLYEYDSLGRLIRSEQSGDAVSPLRTQHQYDAQNRLSSQSWQLPERTLWESYSYNNANGTLKSMGLGTGRSLTFGYDNLLRLQSETLEGVYQRRRNYGETTTANKETQRPNYFMYYKPDGTTVKLGYRYLYDAAGNIKQVYSRVGANALALESSYEYDKLGQLIKADTGLSVESYTYDTAGNMLSRSTAATTTDYGYDNTQWGDLLTSYKGQKIAYEGQTYNSTSNAVTGTPVSGNPISYYGNGNRRWSMTWENGRELATAEAAGRTVSYEYDKNGLRTSKTYNGTRYDYVYAGDKLVWQGWNGNEMYFFYDNTGTPIAFWYFPKGGERVTGYYFTNMQGDVTRIEDPNGNVLATYGYDAWGRNYSASGSMANINPLKYRGYYYDTETGFYYLQSRYYDPIVSRFINADSYASTGQGFLGYNMFAYCGNNPVSRADASGHRPIRIEDLGDFDGGSGGGIFGAGARMVSQQQLYEHSYISNNPMEQALCPISVVTGNYTTILAPEVGNSDRFISAYAQGRMDNYLLSSAGVRIGGDKLKVKLNLALDDISLPVVTGSRTGDTMIENSSGLRIDLTKLQVGIEMSTTITHSSGISDTTYTYYSISGMGLLWILSTAVGVPLPNAPPLVGAPAH